MISSEAPITAITDKTADDDASDVTVESILQNVPLEQGLQQGLQQQQQQQQQQQEDDEVRSQSYLPQQLQQSKPAAPKLSQLQEKWNQSFASSVGSVQSGDSPVVYARAVNLPTVRSSLPTTTTGTKMDNTKGRPPVKVRVTTTNTGKPITPTRAATSNNTAANRILSNSKAPPRTANKTPPRTANKTPPRKSTKSSRMSAALNHQHQPTPPPPDMNAGLYMFAQMGPDGSPPKAIIETFQGSCQCGEIQLQVRLPSHDDKLLLEVETTPEEIAAEEKIYYRYIKARQKDFDITKGQARMSTYFVTMSAPPILASSTAAASAASTSSSSAAAASQKSKFFIRPNQDNTSPRSHSKGARVFCPQCGVHVLYIPGKNAPHLHLNINCFPTLAKQYPPPPPPPKSRTLEREAWFWDPKTYSKYLKSTNTSEGPTGIAFLDRCWQLIQEHLKEYLPSVQDFLADVLMPPPSSTTTTTTTTTTSANNIVDNKSIKDSSSSSKGEEPDTPHSIRESVVMAFEGIPTPESSFLEDPEDIILDGLSVEGAMTEDGSFRIDMIEMDSLKLDVTE